MTKFNHVKLGISPINWTNDDDPNLGGDIAFETCIKEMSQAGFQGTEIGNKYPKDAHKLRHFLSEYQMQVSSAWMSTFFTESGRYQETLENFMHHLSFMKAVGADVINLCECGHGIQQADYPVFSSHKPVFNHKQWLLLINGLHELGRLAYDYQMRVSYHFHLGTGVQNQDEVDYLMKHTSPNLLGLLLDTGHAYAADISLDYLFKHYGARINQVHLKDVRTEVLDQVHKDQLTFMDGVRKGMFTVPGDGCIDFDLVFKQLAQKQYQGWFIVEAEQDPAKANPLEYANKARVFIREKTGL
ncbi:myo-inosose-2 dehydratase [Thiotrichales bacterium 19X7-9]|nr:myo-inosose-2 dehydratase [Thiotrichales bacterium 19X7-9]